MTSSDGDDEYSILATEFDNTIDYEKKEGIKWTEKK